MAKDKIAEATKAIMIKKNKPKSEWMSKYEALLPSKKGKDDKSKDDGKKGEEKAGDKKKKDVKKDAEKEE